MFSEPDHDAGLVQRSLRGAPVAGMFCQGELGPVGGRTFLHGFTATMALFRPT
jgi:small ligand-binding sensory domain FIST